MTLNRNEFAQLLEVQERYLCPSNFQHLQGGAEERGYYLLEMIGKGKNAKYILEPIEAEIDGEVWKNLPLAPEYQVSNMGRIKHPKGGILKGTTSKGYVRTRVKDLGQLPNHRMVMLAFAPIENAENYVVDHINGIKTDNRFENLRWVFQSENAHFSDINNTEMREIIAKLVQKQGYETTKQQLLALLEQ